MGWGDKFRRAHGPGPGPRPGILGGPIGVPPTPPSYVVRDALGRAVQPSDLVLVVQPTQQYVVQSITPCLQPGMPPGHVQVVLATTLNLVVQSGAVLESLYRLGALPKDGAQAEAPPPDPPPPSGGPDVPPQD